ncbi:hypothetical protein M427DRAFT_112086 [Gonapodya prolifera JEL478]|uniref:peptidylprolyl isomerase n=1 Tax=Gonapodya prolifera (strain JEL478) TaxID=1344416 RepID=A0A139AE24_GONPJ|nr:hypothetical protein M427DRAFT_112086 [Gonapodya prolifera JEL478]|eukprot:KXS15076.1 hypothetical protein M427DRAFT_112086 [Gonapodya prolifera JEL478]
MKESPWTESQLKDIAKKDLIQWVQDNATLDFVKEFKLNGKLASLAKSVSKDDALKAYQALISSGSFRGEGEPTALEQWESEKAGKDKEKAANADANAASKDSKGAPAHQEAPKYTKVVVTKGDKTRVPTKGDLVGCLYTGTLTDGKVFDTNVGTGKKGKTAGPLKFKVGAGRVIRGWDEALLTMGLGEKAKLTIEPEWAYGKKGLPDAGIPPNATLIFEVELVSIE